MQDELDVRSFLCCPHPHPINPISASRNISAQPLTQRSTSYNTMKFTFTLTALAALATFSSAAPCEERSVGPSSQGESPASRDDALSVAMEDVFSDLGCIHRLICYFQSSPPLVAQSSRAPTPETVAFGLMSKVILLVSADAVGSCFPFTTADWQRFCEPAPSQGVNQQLGGTYALTYGVSAELKSGDKTYLVSGLTSSQCWRGMTFFCRTERGCLCHLLLHIIHELAVQR